MASLTGSKWTAEEDKQLLAELQSNMGCAKITAAHGRTYTAIIERQKI